MNRNKRIVDKKRGSILQDGMELRYITDLNFLFRDQSLGLITNQRLSSAARILC